LVKATEDVYASRIVPFNVMLKHAEFMSKPSYFVAHLISLLILGKKPNEELCVMRRCVGCKHLVGFGAACKGDEQLTRVEDQMTGVVRWRDLRFPQQGGIRPSPAEMRTEGGRCGPDRTLYEPKLLARALPWLYDA